MHKRPLGVAWTDTMWRWPIKTIYGNGYWRPRIVRRRIAKWYKNIPNGNAPFLLFYLQQYWKHRLKSSSKSQSYYQFEQNASERLRKRQTRYPQLFSNIFMACQRFRVETWRLKRKKNYTSRILVKCPQTSKRNIWLSYKEK